MNLKSRSNCGPSGFADGDVVDASVTPRTSPSGIKPICCGVFESVRSARTQIVITMTIPIAAAAMGKPKNPIAATHNGENTTPPTLAPL
jgi:hypothetical protein